MGRLGRDLVYRIWGYLSEYSILLILGASVGPILIASARANDPLAVTIPVLATLAWISILLASVLRFDFRVDLDVIESLKTLPLRPWAVATGQLIAPTLIMTVIHWLVIAATLAATAKMPAAQAIETPMWVAAVIALLAAVFAPSAVRCAAPAASFARCAA